jgi:hypothetical protein
VLGAAEPEDAWGRQVWATRAEKEDQRRAGLEELATSAGVVDGLLAGVPARQARLAPQVSLTTG